MFRYTKPLTNLAKYVSQSISKPITMSIASRNFAKEQPSTPAPPAPQAAADKQSSTKGAPPVSIEDLYSLYFMSEPTFRPKDREPKDMLETDIRLNEVVLYLNGGLYAPNDQSSEAFTRHMGECGVLYFARDAGRRPEFRKHLKQAGGSDELPQLWIRGKCVGKGKELTEYDRCYELSAPARRPWPRETPVFHSGFIGFEGVTQSDKVQRN